MGRGLCLLALVGSLLALVLPWATPWWLGFDVFSQFTVHFVVIALAGIFGLRLRRRGWLLAAGLVMAGFVGIGLFARLHTVPPPTQKVAGQLRVVMFNTWLRNADVAAMAREVRELAPDFIGMAEFGANKKEMPDMLSDILPYRADCLDKPHCHLAFLSRWPVEKMHAASLWEGPPYLHATVRTPAGRVEVFVVHTLRFPWVRSQFLQVRALARLVRRQKNPVIVLGDFNATPFSAVIREFERATGLRRYSWLPSWPAWAFGLPQLAIDHVFSSSDFEPVRGPYLGGNAGSDHYPVVMELRRAR